MRRGVRQRRLKGSSKQFFTHRRSGRLCGCHTTFYGPVPILWLGSISQSPVTTIEAVQRLLNERYREEPETALVGCSPSVGAEREPRPVQPTDRVADLEPRVLNS